MFDVTRATLIWSHILFEMNVGVQLRVNVARLLVNWHYAVVNFNSYTGCYKSLLVTYLYFLYLLFQALNLFISSSHYNKMNSSATCHFFITV